MPSWDGPYIQSYDPGNLSTPKEVTDNGRTVDKIFAISAEGALGAGEFKGGSATVSLAQRDNYPLVEMGDILVAYTLNPLSGTDTFRTAIIAQFIVVDVELGELPNGTGTVTYSGPGLSKELIRKVLRTPYISTKYSGTTTAYTETYVFLDAAHAEADDFYNGGVIEINGSLADIWNYSSAENRVYVNNWRGNAPEDGNDPLPYIIHHGKATDNLDQAISYSQTTWVNSLNGGAVSGTPGGSFNVVDGRTPLDMLNVIANETGYQYRNLLVNPPARQLDWFNPQGTPVTSGLLIKAKSVWTEAQLYADPSKAIVIAAQRRTSRRDKWTRMIVATADGLTLHGLTLSDVTVPTGFTVDFDQSMVTHTAAETGFTTPEIFEKSHVFKDISSPSNTAEAQKETKIALFNATISKMNHKAGQYHTYEVRTSLLRDVQVGQQCHLEYVNDILGEVRWSVNSNLWIRNIALSCNADTGIRYVDLELGDQYEADISDGNRATARAIKDSQTATGQIFFGTPAVSGGVKDHGGLLGLTDVEDHPGYLLVDGSRQLTGNLSVLTSVTIDGVDISVHAATANAHHEPVTAGGGLLLSGQEVSMGTPTYVGSVTTDEVSGTGHTHAVYNTDDGDALKYVLLRTDAAGNLKTSGLSIGSDAARDSHVIVGDAVNMKGTGYQGAGPSGFTKQWLIDTENSDGEGTLYISNIIADTLIIDLLQAEMTIAITNGLLISKSVGIVSESWTVPDVGNTAFFNVKDNPVFGAAAIFEDNDKVVFRVFDRSGGGLVTTWIGGFVDNYSDNGDGTQEWKFHCHEAGPGDVGEGMLVHQGTPIIDYGKPGQPWIDIDASEATGPRMAFGTWDGANPWDSANHKTNLEIGQLQGITGVNETGLFVGESILGSHLLMSDSSGASMQDVEYKLLKGTTDYGFMRIYALALDSDQETDVRPNGDVSGSLARSSGTDPFYTYINEDPEGTMPDSNWLTYQNTQSDVDGEIVFDMEDLSHTLTSLTFKFYIELYDYVDDSMVAWAQMFKNDGSPLTDKVRIGSESSLDGLHIIPFTGILSGTDAEWAAARLKLTFHTNIRGDTRIVTIDKTEGISIYTDGASGYTGQLAYTFVDESTDITQAGLYSNEITATQYQMYLNINQNVAKHNRIYVHCEADTGYDASVWLIATPNDGADGSAGIVIDFASGGASDIGLAADTVDISGAVTVDGDMLIDQGTDDGIAFDIRNDDVTNMTVQGMNHDNSYFQVSKISAAEGGALIRAGGESDRALQLTGSANVGTGTTYAPVIAQGMIDNAAVPDTQNVFAVFNYATGVFYIKGDGDAYSAGEHLTFDNLASDIEMVRNLSLLAKGAIRTKDDDSIRYTKEDAAQAGLIELTDSGYAVSLSKRLELHGGALWELHRRLKRIEEYQRGN